MGGVAVGIYGGFLVLRRCLAVFDSKETALKSIMAAQIETATTTAAKYGEYGFGVVAVCVLVTVLGLVWKKVFEPTFALQLKIAESNAQITANLSTTASTLERTMTETKHVASRNQDMLDRLQRLEENREEHT